MNGKTLVLTLIALTALIFAISACEKEKIVESTEYISETEYITLPPDTVFQVRIDTVYTSDSTIINNTDTVTITVHDTVVQVTTIIDTVFSVDTVTTIQHHYDTTTVTIVDTVTTLQCDPNEYLAMAALQYYANSEVIQFINSEFGYTDGWVLYLNPFQSDVQSPSAGVYDIYGYIDYWTPEWDGYYVLEYYYRIDYTSGDPTNPENWTLSEPPAASPTRQPGMRIVPETSDAIRDLR
ncbi:MAG: hypothetical protein KKA42_08310 [candidate division Zixibacteria bacterium]|nr:hypothetical protein [candidate division Zixibacteria bacterium]